MLVSIDSLNVQSLLNVRFGSKESEMLRMVFSRSTMVQKLLSRTHTYMRQKRLRSAVDRVIAPLSQVSSDLLMKQPLARSPFPSAAADQPAQQSPVRIILVEHARTSSVQHKQTQLLLFDVRIET